MFVAEQLLVALLPEVGRWTPGGALLLVGYAVLLSAAGARVTLRRDLT